jgi:ATP-binding cassette subfamily C protein LapB
LFAYPGTQRPALEIDRLAIRPGERVAIVGGIGSGKSTLLKLLSGLYSPPRGTTLIGGLDLSQIAEDISRRHIGYLPQDARLVNGTLRDNLVMGLGDISDQEIMDVAKTTRLDQMIAGRPEGLALQIQEGGRGLSGGQRSLVGLNRLLHGRPCVWLLDEPSAALDQGTEAAVLDAIDWAMDKDGILVMVTHKPQLLSRFSRIIVMSGGRITKDGPADEVLRKIISRPRVAAEKKGGRITGEVTAAFGGKEAS